MIYFGTTEESATVKAEDLEPGVRISGENFNRTSVLVVQDVRPPANGTVRVEAADFENGEHLTQFLYADRPMTCWGKI